MTFPRDTRCDCGARGINDTADWVVVKFIADHNYLLSTTLSKSKLHRLDSDVHRTNAVRRLVCSLNNEGIDPSNIARVCNAVGGLPEQNITARHAVTFLDKRGEITWAESVWELCDTSSGGNRRMVASTSLWI